ncbi:MAG: chromosome segregation ATPase [Waterburya sp.]
MKTQDQPIAISGQWCLVTVSQWKRESFLKYLNNDIEKKQLQNVILEIIALEESVYENMVLLRISNYSEARTHLQQIDHFQNIQRLKPNEVSRMLNK